MESKYLNWQKGHKLDSLTVLGLGALLAILIALFYIGVGLLPSLQISTVAAETADSIREPFSRGFDNSTGTEIQANLADLRAKVGALTIIHAFPIAIFYMLLGVNDFSSMILPIGSALINVFLVYQLAQEFIKDGPHLIVTFLWIVLPATIFPASVLAYTHPAILLFLVALLSYLRKKSWLIIVLLILALVVFDPLLGTALILLLITLNFQSRQSESIPLIVLIGASAFLLLITGDDLGFGFIRFYESLRDLPEMQIMLPIIFIAFAAGLRPDGETSRPLLVLSLLSFLGLLARSMFFFNPSLMLDPFLNLFLLSIIMIFAGRMAPKLGHEYARKSSILSGVLFIFACLVVRIGQQRLIPDYQGLDPHSLIPALKILAGPVVLLAIFAYYLSLRESYQKYQWLLVSLLVLFVLSLIPSIWTKYKENRSVVLAADQAMTSLDSQPLKLPITIVDDDRLAMQIAYLMRNHPMEYDIRQVSLTDIDSNENTYVLISEGVIHSWPLEWWHMANFGDLGSPRLILVRTLRPSDAETEFDRASLAAEDELSRTNLLRLTGAAFNSGRTCEAISTWIMSQLVKSNAENDRILPLYNSPISECVSVELDRNLLQDQSPLIYHGYGRFEYLGEEKNFQEGTAFTNKYPFFDDPRTFHFDIPLKPDSIYFYQVSVQSSQYVMPLFVSLADNEYYLSYDQYREETTLSILFSTYGMDEEMLDANFSPLLLELEDYNDFVFLKNLRLSELVVELLEE